MHHHLGAMVSSSQVYPRADITGIVLAGGGRRMGGADKGLIEFHDKPMVSFAIGACVSNVRQFSHANRNIEAYQR